MRVGLEQLLRNVGVLPTSTSNRPRTPANACATRAQLCRETASAATTGVYQTWEHGVPRASAGEFVCWKLDRADTPVDQHLLLFLPRSPFYHGAADDQHDEHAEPEECAKRRALLLEHITLAHCAPVEQQKLARIDGE